MINSSVSGAHVTWDFSRSLLEQSVAPATAAAYKRGYREFKVFLFERYHMLPTSLTRSTVDFYFCEFVEHVWKINEGKKRQSVVNAKHGFLLKFGYRFKKCFPQSDRCLITWKKGQPVLSALPVPQRWLDVLAYIVVRSGHGLFGIGLLVAFDACLRASELCGLYGSDILLPGDNRE